MGSVTIKKVLSDLKKELSSVSSPKDRLLSAILFIERIFSLSGAVCYAAKAGREFSVVASAGNPAYAAAADRHTAFGGPVSLTFETIYPLQMTLDDAEAGLSKGSYFGVPLFKGTKHLGVLACYQSKTSFSPEATDFLKTIGIFIAELLYQSQDSSELSSVSSGFSARYDGYPLVGGIGYGLAYFHSREIEDFSFFAERASENEKKRLEQAIEQLSDLMEKKSAGLPIDERSIFSAHQMLLKDKGLFARTCSFIDNGISAEAAVILTYVSFASQFAQISDRSIREKVIDLEDIAFRLCNFLTGQRKAVLTQDVILVSKTLGPAELFDYDLSHVKGILLEEASPTMHVTIIARSAGIPFLGGISDLSRKIRQNDPILLDAGRRMFCVNPPRDLLAGAFSKMKASLKTSAFYKEIKKLPAETQDGQKIFLYINAGLVSDVDVLAEGIAEGIGLYRTELPFMMNDKTPSVDEQIHLYRRIYQKAEGKKVVFRTLDVGSDKVLPSFGRRVEANPAMGLRSIRLSIDRKAILRQQIRALLIAAEDRPLDIMFPMITEVSEFIEAKETVLKELQFIHDQGYPRPSELRLGSMIEVPALILQLPALLPLVDFVSVGTNDLAQFLFAYDRSNLSLAGRYDLLAPSMIAALKEISQTCARFKKPCSVCGEMAGQPLDAMVLLGLGFTQLSMNASSLINIKMMLRSLDLSSVREYIDSLKVSPADTLRGRFMEFAVDRGIHLEMTDA